MLERTTSGKAVVAGPRQQSRSCCPQRDYVCSFEVKNYDVMADAILREMGTPRTAASRRRDEGFGTRAMILS
jgi:hypothetical protein